MWWWLWHDIGSRRKWKHFARDLIARVHFHHVRLESRAEQSRSQCHIFTWTGNEMLVLLYERFSHLSIAAAFSEKSMRETNCKLALGTVCAKKIFENWKHFPCTFFPRGSNSLIVSVESTWQDANILKSQLINFRYMKAIGCVLHSFSELASDRREVLEEVKNISLNVCKEISPCHQFTFYFFWQIREFKIHSLSHKYLYFVY